MKHIIGTVALVALLGCGEGEGAEDVLLSKDTPSTDEGLIESCPAQAPFGSGPCTGYLTCYYLSWQTCGPYKFDICTCQNGLWSCTSPDCPPDPGPDIQELPAQDTNEEVFEPPCLTVCDDDDPCTVDSCLPVSGHCVHDPLDCDDGDLCTTDSCDPEDTDGNPCRQEPVDCHDFNSTTADFCDSATGECYHVEDGHPCEYHDVCESQKPDPCHWAVPLSFGSWDFSTTCDIDSPCSVGSCILVHPGISHCLDCGGCEFYPVVCDDGDACTMDLCDPTDSDGDPCQHESLNCDDDNDCTMDWCDPYDEDGKPCQNDWNPEIDCFCVQDWECIPPNNCFAGQCQPYGVPEGTCVFVEVKCEDGNQCTVGTCDPEAFGGDGGCVFTPKDCDDDNLCTVDGCNPTTGCYNWDDSQSCNDNIFCTVDTCNSETGCLNILTPNEEPEKCNSIDDNCDGCTDEGCTLSSSKEWLWTGHYTETGQFLSTLGPNDQPGVEMQVEEQSVTVTWKAVTHEDCQTPHVEYMKCGNDLTLTLEKPECWSGTGWCMCWDSDYVSNVSTSFELPPGEYALTTHCFVSGFLEKTCGTWNGGFAVP